MFPKKNSNDLMQAIRYFSTVPEAHEDDVSSDDDSLFQSTFSPSETKIDSFKSLLKELGRNISEEKVKVTIEDEDY